MEICINNYGIIFEIVGFVLLLTGVRHWFDDIDSNEINHKRPNSKKKRFSYWASKHIRDIGIVLVIAGLVMQLSFFNTC